MWKIDPYGNLEGYQGSVSTALLYTGKGFDADVDAWYFNARFYDAERGSFTGRDPKLQFWTPYSYVGNGPLVGLDPDGLLKLNLYDPSDEFYYNAAEALPDNPDELIVFAHGADNGVAAIMSNSDGSGSNWDASEFNQLLADRGIDPSSFKRVRFDACWTGADKPVDFGDGTMVQNTFARDFSALNPKAKVLAPTSPIFYLKSWAEKVDANGVVLSRTESILPLLRFGDPYSDDYYHNMTDREGSWKEYTGRSKK